MSGWEERLANEWRQAERDADDYGPRSAFTGYDCAEMLEDALDEGGNRGGAVPDGDEGDGA